MVNFKRIVLFCILLLCVLSLYTDYSDASVSEVNLTIDSVEYDEINEQVSFSGTSNTDIVNVRVYASNYNSAIDASIVNDGHYSDTIRLEDLDSNIYYLEVSYNATVVCKKFVVGSENIILESASYDPTSRILSFSGYSSLEIVNVRLYSNDYTSVIDACVVNNTRFSDSIYLGVLSVGEYILEASNGTQKALMTVTVVSDSITITELSYSGEILTYAGFSSFDLINLVVQGPGEYVSSINGIAVVEGQFNGTFNLGFLKSGTYEAIFSANNHIVRKEFTIGNSDPYQADSRYSEDGKQLIEYWGSVSEYILPTFIESISEGAFNNAKIETFVLTKDVSWDIKINNNRFPFQDASLKHVIIEDGVQIIPDYLFAHTELDEVVIPSSVREIGVKAFYLCSNLTSVTVNSASHLTKIGAYSFSSNELLNDVKINDSAEGYSCSIDEGGFFACGAITLRISSGFSLTSIGYCAFANDVVTMLLDDEVGDVIHIPGTVATLGRFAFSKVAKEGGKEPGLNTVHDPGSGVISAPSTAGNNGVTGRAIVFETNPHLTTIPVRCFTAVSVDSIDLSGCSALEVIEYNAFMYCLDTGGGANINWPDNLQTIQAAAFKCRGTTDNGNDVIITFPASVTRIEQYAVEGLCQHIAFEEGSELRYFSGLPYMNGYKTIDFSNCSKVECLGRYWSTGKEITLPAGMYSIERSSDRPGNNIDPKTPAVSSIGGVLEILDDTVAIIYYDVSEIQEIRCDPSNKYFDCSDGILVFDDGNTRKILLTNGVRSVHITAEDTRVTEVAPVAVSSTAVSLYLDLQGIEIDQPFLLNANNLKSVYLQGSSVSWDIETAFDGVKTGITYYVPETLSIDNLNYLKGLGEVYVGYSVGNDTIYCPADYRGGAINLDNLSKHDGSLEASFSIVGFDVGDLDLVVIGGKITYNSNRIVIDNVSQSTHTAYLRIMEKASYSDDLVYVTFTDEYGNSVTVSVKTGGVLAKDSVPCFVKDCYDLVGWRKADNSEFDVSSAILQDLVLYPIWRERAPMILIDQTAASIILNGTALNDDHVVSDQHLVFTATPNAGYEIQRWIVNGLDAGDALSPLELDLEKDSTLSISYTYYSPSTGMNNINNTSMPTSEDILDIVHAYTIGGFVNTNGSVWTGMTSIPLIVDDYVYVRIAGKIYKAESDTGYIVKSADSKSMETFYHYLGYGGGYIIDYNADKVFDLDLNQLYVLGRDIDSANYYNGLFYVLGDTIYSFDPTDEDLSSVDEVKELRVVGRTDGMYGLYGVYAHEFVGDYVYFMTNHGDSRGIGAMRLSDGSTSDFNLKSLEYMFLDDGWLTYYEGYIFITAYSAGLFGATATSHNSRMAYVPVNGLEFGEEKYYEFGGKSFSSRLAVFDNRAFVAISGTLNVFDLPTDMTNLDLDALPHRTAQLVSGHGNFVLDVSHVSEDGAPIYAYGIPYDTHQGPTMWIAVDRAGQLTSVSTEATEREWNSQTFRSDSDGRLLWYNDSGWLYCYTVSEKNVYYFFIEDGDSAIWYEARGATVAEALASLGPGVITMNSANAIQAINGHDVQDGFTVEMLKATYGTYDNNKQFDNLDQYSWVLLDNLSDTAYSLNHYFRIVCGGGKAISAGDSFVFLGESGQESYLFTDNIGDRSIIGKLMCRGEVGDSLTIKFVEDGAELIDLAIVVTSGTPVKVHLPEVVKAGYYPVWSDSNGVIVSDIYGKVFTDNTALTLTWIPLPPKYIVAGEFRSSNENTTWSASISVMSGIGETDGICLKYTAITESGQIMSGSLTTMNGAVSGQLASSDVKMIYVRVINDGVSGNSGYCVIQKEVRP